MRTLLTCEIRLWSSFFGRFHTASTFATTFFLPNHTTGGRPAKLILNGHLAVHRHNGNGLRPASKFTVSLSNSAMAKVVRGCIKRRCFRIFDWLRDRKTPRPLPQTRTNSVHRVSGSVVEERFRGPS